MFFIIPLSLSALSFLTAIGFLVRSLESARGEEKILDMLVGLHAFLLGFYLLPIAIPEATLLGLGCFVTSFSLMFLAARILQRFVEYFKNFRSLRLFPPKKLTSEQQEICRAAERLASKRTGALMVLERKESLENYLSTGIRFDAQVLADIIVPLFATSSPVHDGALVVSRGRIKAVKVVLPLASGPHVPMNVGTRHRSAIGVSEKHDCVVVVVSEERGVASIAFRGQLASADSPQKLRSLLQLALQGRDIVSRKQPFLDLVPA